jgi:hypothetical protein
VPVDDGLSDEVGGKLLAPLLKDGLLRKHGSGMSRPTSTSLRRKEPMMVAMSLSENSWDIPIGTPVESADGRRLGVVTHADSHELLVENGMIFRHAYALGFMDVARYQDGVLKLKLTATEVIEQREIG